MAESLDTYSDLEDSEVDTLTESFNKAADHVKKLVPHLDPPKLLEIYSYYKQAMEGPCNIPRPRWYEMQAKAKWDAWNSLGNLTSEDAKRQYISLISTLDPNFFSSTTDNVNSDPSEEKVDKSESWAAVSSFLNTEESLRETDKTIFDFVKEGDLENLSQHLSEDLSQINERDEEGMGLLHWAADRGCVPILSHLINQNADVNMADNEGQTALHYAASCGHVDCVQLLVKNGADKGKTDSEGLCPVDLTSDSKILELLTSNV